MCVSPGIKLRFKLLFCNKICQGKKVRLENGNLKTIPFYMAFLFGLEACGSSRVRKEAIKTNSIDSQCLYVATAVESEELCEF